MANGVHIMVTGVNLPVETSTGSKLQTGLSFAVHRGRILISIIKGGEGLSAWIGGDQIDLFAGMLADKVQEATRFEAPSVSSLQ